MIERSRTWQPGRPVNVAAVLGVHRRGFYDPAFQVALDGTVWRGCRVGERPVTVRIRVRPGLGDIEITAWADDDVQGDAPADEVRGEVLAADDALTAVLDAVPRWLGALDDPTGFDPRHPVLARAFRENPGVLVGRTDAVVEALVPAVLEQKVTGIEAYRGWSAMVRKFGVLAPGVGGAAAAGPVPPGLRVPPAAAQWARIPSWEWHRAGVGPQRARTIVTATRSADRLSEAAALPSEEADRRLRAVPGIGVWTSAEVRQRSHGDPDALSVGDFGLPHVVSYALTGERRGSDERMLELLEPYRGHRHRACLLLLAAGVMPPRRGPRAPVRDYRAI